MSQKSTKSAMSRNKTRRTQRGGGSSASASVTPNTCFILVKFKKDVGTVDIESIKTDFTECAGAQIFTGDFKTMDFTKEYLFEFELDPTNPHASNVTQSSDITTCTPTLKTQLDSLFSSGSLIASVANPGIGATLGSAVVNPAANPVAVGPAGILTSTTTSIKKDDWILCNIGSNAFCKVSEDPINNDSGNLEIKSSLKIKHSTETTNNKLIKNDDTTTFEFNSMKCEKVVDPNIITKLNNIVTNNNRDDIDTELSNILLKK